MRPLTLKCYTKSSSEQTALNVSDRFDFEVPLNPGACTKMHKQLPLAHTLLNEDNMAEFTTPSSSTASSDVELKTSNQLENY